MGTPSLRCSSGVQSLIHQYRSDLLPRDTPCRSDADCVFTFQIDTAYWKRLYGHGAWFDASANRLAYRSENTVLARIGMRNFLVTVGIKQTGGVLESSSASVIGEGDCQKWLGAGWRLLPEMPSFSKAHSRKAIGPDDDVVITWSHLHLFPGAGEMLDAVVTPGATSAEEAAAFGINMNCLTSTLGCFLLADLMPAAVQLQKSRGHWLLGWTSQTCPKHTNAD